MNHPPTPLPELMTREEVATFLRVCAPTVARYTKRGKLPAIRLNNQSVRYRVSDVLALVNGGSVNDKVTANT